MWLRGVLLCAATAIAAPAQTFNTLLTFEVWEGAAPFFVTLVQGTDGNFYGTTHVGGPADGTVFKITPGGTLTTLHSFNGPDGNYSSAGLIQGLDSTFYGITRLGGSGNCGSFGCGTVFKMTMDGTLTTLHNFVSTDGAEPYTGLVQGTDGKLYGTTSIGGAGQACNPVGNYVGCGTAFKITPGGTITTLHTFCYDSFSCGDGAGPIGGLVQGTDGSLYGTTTGGGNSAWAGSGTVFKIAPGGKLTTLYRFCAQPNCTDGSYPFASLMFAADGNLYGTTSAGGEYGAGTIFRITPAGALTTLHSFDGSDGSSPTAGLVQGTDGDFYGTAELSGGGTDCFSGCGTVFKMTIDGTLTKLHDFSLSDGFHPYGGLVQSTNGLFYGVTLLGGDLTCSWDPGVGCGSVFSLDMGLGPFVASMRSSGKVGQKGGILGQGFTGTTDVSLNGTPATFTVVSDTYLTATVPAGATTGFVTVATPSGTLTSNKVFRVTPQLLNFDPPSGPVGTVVTITGVSLTQTTGVGFGDYVPAQFTVDSDGQVTATVPTGAQTGRVGIQALGGIAKSSGTFTVTP